MGRKKGKIRPDGWSKEVALELARTCPHKELEYELSKIGAVSGTKVATLHKDLKEWRTLDKEFRKLWFEARDLFSYRQKRGGRPVEFTDEKKVDWLIEYRECGRVATASDRIGVSWGHVYNLTREGHAEYDEIFAAEYQKIRRVVLGRLEDTVFEIAMDPEEDSKTRLHAATRALESLDKENWGRSSRVEMAGKVEHRHTHEVEASKEEIHRQLKEDFGGLFLPPAKEDEDIVDVEVIEESS